MSGRIRCQGLAETYSTFENLFPFFKIHFDVSKGEPCRYEAESVMIGGVRVNSVHNSLGARVTTKREDHELSLVFVERGANVVERNGHEVATAPVGDCTISTLLKGDVVKVAAGSARLLVHINYDLIDDVIARHFHVAPPTSIDFPDALRAEQPQRALLGGLVRHALDGVECAQGPFAQVLSKQYSDVILSSLLLAVPNSFSSILGKASDVATSRYVKRALDSIRANLDQPIDRDDIARNAACSPRRLQLAFRAEFGMTPMAVLKMERLGLAERRLRAGECGDVTSLALSLGFTNPGRFSGEFRQKFGVLPSEILATTRL